LASSDIGGSLAVLFPAIFVATANRPELVQTRMAAGLQRVRLPRMAGPTEVD
jgi:hypothetical protein